MHEEAEAMRVVIAARGLAKRFGDVQAVAGVDFDVRRGELFGFLGPNGAGKTTNEGDLAAFEQFFPRHQNGACKTVVGRQLKYNGARWTAANADRMAALCGLHYSDQREAYWRAIAA